MSLAIMVAANVPHEDISVPERDLACRAAREYLVRSVDLALRPRQRNETTGEDDGEDALAYLQHDLHT